MEYQGSDVKAGNDKPPLNASWLENLMGSP